MTNGFARYYTPCCYLDVCIRSAANYRALPQFSLLSPLVSRLGRGGLPAKAVGVFFFGGKESRVHDLEGGEELLEGDERILLGMFYAQKNRHFAGNASTRWLKVDSAPSDEPITRFALPPTSLNPKCSLLCRCERDREPILQASDSCM